MKFRAPEQKKNRIAASPDLTPLIDVVFLLIIFFMLSATFVVQSSIQVELPEAEGATELESKDLTITMTYDPSAPDGEGRIYVDSEEIADWRELSERLAYEVQQDPEVMLLIKSDGRVQMARTVRLWGIATSLGIERFGVAAEPPELDE